MGPPSRAKLKRPWQEVAKEAENHRRESLAKVEGLPPAIERIQLSSTLPQNSIEIPEEILDSLDFQITQKLPEELLSLMADGKLSSVQVTSAFLRRAVLAQKLTNCITELLPERALARAKYLDDYLTQHKCPIGPLHGLPISVKEMIGINDLGLNAGYVSWWGKTATEDAHVLQILWNAGAVFHARTTQPQSMMHLETDSNLYGVTVNPYNRETTCGGSSGGEGALIAMRGSVLGVGSDIGGSIRNPAANCGIYGFKPTSFRIPTDGWCSTMAGADPIPGVIGPMSSSIEGIIMFMQVIISSKPWLLEPALVPMPWILPLFSSAQPLKIGIMWHDNVVTPHPPITRAVQEVLTRLKVLQNVEVVDWKPYLHDEAWAIISSLYFTDGGAEDAATIAESGEPWRPLTKWIIKENPCVKKLTAQKLYYWQEEREAYRKEYANVWNDTATGRNKQGSLEGMVDVILCPAAPGVAPAHNTSKYWAYTSQWNLLDYPAITFKVSKSDRARDAPVEQFKPMTDIDEEHWKLCKILRPTIYRSCYSNGILDNANRSHGLPISLQLVGRRFEDEKVLAVLKYLTAEIGLPL
ncbi:putative amidase [Lachnellula suecica]|uniref:amidase n=1 Tax=Lachnellula suecica TaxID=602035 RepID=A0A8T9CI26_9HELO|nr:putative amidase [Lachnellula suecica]